MATAAVPAPRDSTLEELVDVLAQRCPWTRAVEPAVMLRFLESECREVAEELEKTGPGSGGTAAATAREGAQARPLADLEAEFGDCFFDLLLLGKALERKFGTAHFSVARARARVVEKMQGRCSYIWGEDAAETPEACEAIFAKRKAEQKLAKARSAAGQESGPDT